MVLVENCSTHSARGERLTGGDDALCAWGRFIFVASGSSLLHGKVIGNEIGLRGPIRRVPCEFPFPIGGADANTAPTNISGKFDIAITIADHEGSPQIKTMLESRPPHPPGPRLSTVTVRRRRVRHAEAP